MRSNIFIILPLLSFVTPAFAAPRIESDDGKSYAQFHARLSFDGGWAVHDRPAQARRPYDVRYLRLESKGQIKPQWLYKISTEWKDAELKLEDALIDYQATDALTLRAGQFWPFFSIEQLSSDKHNHFLERASGVTRFSGSRKMGAALTYEGEGWLSQFGVFGTNASRLDHEDDRYSVSARLSATPLLHKATNQLLHLGISQQFRKRDRQQAGVSFRASGDSKVAGTTLINTGTLPAVEELWLTGLEMRYTHKSLSLMSEYHVMHLPRLAAPSVNFQGAYISASYFLTGEQRSYSTGSGAYGGVTPNAPLHKGGLGAWEIGARYSWLDLQDADVRGGALSTYSAGINWYPHKVVKLMANYSISDVEVGVTSQNPHYFMTRLQIAF